MTKPSAPTSVEPFEPQIITDRRRLATEVLVASIVISAATVTIQMLAWDAAYKRTAYFSESTDWNPLNDLGRTLAMMPFGFVVHSIFPAGWLFWTGFVATLWSRNRLFIGLSLLGAIWFGLVWPRQYQGILGI